MRQLDRRISRLEWLLQPPPPRCQVIRIRGGLPDQDGCHASVGELRFQRQRREGEAALEKQAGLAKDRRSR